MTDYRSQSSIGARILAARRQRGYRATRDLVSAMPGSNITEAALENIEYGRKTDLSISQLLNISRALGVPPSFLLAPIVTPDAKLDLPNLSDALQDMSAAEFDAWLCSIPTSGYRSTVAAERIDIDQLNALRELLALRREARRLSALLQIESDAGDPELETAAPATRNRLDSVQSDARQLEEFLRSAGWVVDEDEQEG